MRIKVFGKTWTLTCKLHIKVTNLLKTWNDPTVNTHILPQAVSRKTILEVQFLTKVLNSIFPKVRGSLLRQYSITWSNSCCKFNGNSIRTRSKRSQGSRTKKFKTNHEFILDCCYFGARRQRRQPLNWWSFEEWWHDLAPLFRAAVRDKGQLVSEAWPNQREWWHDWSSLPKELGWWLPSQPHNWMVTHGSWF
jgi:hypothetical protein